SMQSTPPHCARPPFPTRLSSDLNALASLKHLEHLYLYQTEASAKAVLRLREANPDLHVVTSMELPEPMDSTPDQGSDHVKVHGRDRKSTRLNSSHVKSSYAVFCL